MKLKDHHDAYLQRVSRRLSQKLGRSVSKREILEAVLDLALLDEGLFDPADLGNPVSQTRREILKAESDSRMTGLSPQELLDRVLLGQTHSSRAVIGETKSTP